VHIVGIRVAVGKRENFWGGLALQLGQLLACAPPLGSPQRVVESA